MGLPYHAMKHFSNEVSKSSFEDARRRYCLPVLDPDIIKCTEVPINGTTCESADNFVRFKSLNASEYNEDTGKSKSIPSGLYRITSPFPRPLDHYGANKLRIDNEGEGVMVLQMFEPDPYSSLVGAANAYGELGYASLLHR